jgi:uncharacterized protein
VATVRKCHFEVYQDRQNHWRWRLRDTNGRIIADSGEGYTTKQGAIAGIQNVCSCCQNADVVDV